MTRELVFLGVLFALAVTAIVWRYRHPQLYAANVVAPGNRLNRLQHMGLIYAILGVIITAGIQIINRFHPVEPNYRAGLLGGSEGYVLVGAATFLIGWIRRRKLDSSSCE